MSAAATVNQITSVELQFVPAVLAGVQAAEATGAPGHAKAQAVIDGVIAGSGVVAGQAGVQPTVAGIAALVNLTVSILNALGIFKKKAAHSA